jgi:hypothetical protein
MIKFLKTFSPDGAIYEINNLTSVLSKDTVDWENIYFLWWIKEWLNKRASDDDITHKNYFVIDLDLRNEYERITWEKCDTDSIIEEAKCIKEYLDQDEWWKDWRYIVFSWNWIHIYYVWKTLEIGKDIDKQTYSYGAQKIYDNFKKYFNSKWITPDYACRNIWRITRLPWTINKKNGEVCRILYENVTTSKFMGVLSTLWRDQMKIEKEKEEIERKKYLDEQKKRIEKHWADWNFYEVICKEYPAYILAEEMNWFKLATNWKNFINEKRGYCWYWYDKENNIIHNGWSTHYFLNHNWYNPYMILKEWKNLEDKEVFTYFRNQFKNAWSKTD